MWGKKNQPCLFCGTQAEFLQLGKYFNYHFIKCPVCGVYVVQTDPFLFGVSLKDKIASYLYYSKYSKRIPNTENDNNFVFLGEKKVFEEISKTNSYGCYVSEDELHAFYPRTFSDKIDKILLGFAEKSSYFGDIIVLDKRKVRSAFFIKCYDSDGSRLPENKVDAQFTMIKNYLHSNKFTNDFVLNSGSCEIILQPDGWNRIDKLQQEHGKKSNTVFIAMSFAPETQEAREAIKSAITENGFEPRIMDEIEHNHQIVPEMLYQIREARFIVADFTNHNNGAYYEAGYALGLGKDVIHVCQKERFGQDGHFDIKQINTVLWENPDDLRVRLSARIQATIL